MVEDSKSVTEDNACLRVQNAELKGQLVNTHAHTHTQAQLHTHTHTLSLTHAQCHTKLNPQAQELEKNRAMRAAIPILNQNAAWCQFLELFTGPSSCSVVALNTVR